MGTRAYVETPPFPAIWNQIQVRSQEPGYFLIVIDTHGTNQ